LYYLPYPAFIPLFSEFKILGPPRHGETAGRFPLTAALDVQLTLARNSKVEILKR
jgi:hypothetical protein